MCGGRLRWVDMAAAALPLALVAALLIIYHTAPQFYLRYILHPEAREHQAVEVTTFACSLLAGVFILAVALWLWRQRLAVGSATGAGRGAWLRSRAGVLLLTIVAMAALFFAGEEISWGQTYLGYATPDSISEVVPETNLHNIHGLPISVNSLGSAFLLVVFVALPVAWRWRRSLNLPVSLAVGVAETPVVWAMVVAFVWKLYKSLYRLWVTDPEQQQFYRQFVEQINEQKEMLVAVSLATYALYRIPAARRAVELAGSSGATAAQRGGGGDSSS